MKILRIFHIITWAAVLVTAASCSKEEDNDGFILGGDGSNSGMVIDNLFTRRLEVPALKSGNIFIQHSTKYGNDSIMNYCIEYDTTKFHSRWVAFRFDGITRQKKVSRKDYDISPQYPRDPKLPSEYALEDALYGSGYNHGHLCASADRLFSREGNDQTFYMTNMSPQQSNFNSSYWAEFEQYVQGKGRDKNFSDTLYVCKGGTIDEDKIIKRVADNRIVVPKYYFMALLKVKNGAYSAIAFYMEHKNYGRGYSPTYAEMAEHSMSIDELESFTGIDFFHNLPDAIENSVESFHSTSAWGL